MKELFYFGIAVFVILVASAASEKDSNDDSHTLNLHGRRFKRLNSFHETPNSISDDVHFRRIQDRYQALRHNIVKRSPGWKSKGGSKSKGGFFSSSSKANKGNNKGHDQQQNYGKPSAPAYPQQNHGYGQPAYNPNYGAHQPAHNPYGHPGGYAPAPAYHPPAPAPAYHPPAPQQPQVVVVHGQPGGAVKGPGLGSALATGLASGVGTGVGFGAANAVIGGLTGGNRHHDDYRPAAPAPAPASNDGNNGNNYNNNNNNNNRNDYSNQANPECLRTCFSTEEYAPVCGTDGMDYTNIGKLNCMKTCGKSVEIARYGPCYIAPPPPAYGVAPVGGQNNPPPPPPPNSPVASPDVPSVANPVNNGGLPQGVEGATGLITGGPIVESTTPNGLTSTTTMSPEYVECFQKCNATSEYNPICGNDGLDYSNPGRLSCAKSCGKVVELAFQGSCVNTTVLSRQ